MRNLFVLLLVMISLATQAQKIRYTDKRNHWVTVGIYGFDNPTGTIRYVSYGSDTVIGGLTYRRRIENFVWSIDSVSHFVREDTIDGVVYGMAPHLYTGTGSTINLDYDTVEHVLFNYNRQGDTIQNFFADYQFVDSVVFFDSTIINGVYHKIWGLQRISPLPAYQGYSYIEGIGSCAFPHYPFCSCFEGDEKLVCFYQQDGSDTSYISIQTPFFYCTSFDSVNTVSGCASLAVRDINKLIPSVSISPNPATDEIKISIENGTYKNVSLSIYDMQGRAVYNNTIVKEETTINCSSWPEGTYLAVVQTENGILKKEKIVVVH